jgi:hypothetical protein
MRFADAPLHYFSFPLLEFGCERRLQKAQARAPLAQRLCGKLGALRRVGE